MYEIVFYIRQNGTVGRAPFSMRSLTSLTSKASEEVKEPLNARAGDTRE